MHPDIIELRSFYDTTLGHLAERAIRMALAGLWEHVPGERLVGMGYSLPYLERFSVDTERTFAFMPAGQGAIAWPSVEKTATALVFDEELPLPDSSIDRVLMVHALEYAENPTETLKEMWRVLAPMDVSSLSCLTGAAFGPASNIHLSAAGGLTAGRS